MSSDFNLADSGTVATVASVTPAPVAGEIFTLWTSPEMGQGTGLNSVTVNILYEALDNQDANPKQYDVFAVIQTKQADGVWEEIGRQFAPIRHLSQGANRQMIVSPSLFVFDEGIDAYIEGPQGIPAWLKSKEVDNAEGILRVLLCCIDPFIGETDPAVGNPLVSVTFSASARRYDS